MSFGCEMVCLMARHSKINSFINRTINQFQNVNDTLIKKIYGMIKKNALEQDKWQNVILMVPIVTLL